MNLNILPFEFPVPVQAGVVQQMEWNMRRVLGNDTSPISTLRCLKLYLERLGCNFLDQESVQMLAGMTHMPAFVSAPPSSILCHWGGIMTSV